MQIAQQTGWRPSTVRKWRFRAHLNKPAPKTIPGSPEETSIVLMNVKIEADHYVLNLEKVRQILSSAYKISVMDCVCRTTYGHCDAPLTVCLDMNEVAERSIVEFGAREITLRGS